MSTTAPTNKQLIDALGLLLSAYARIDSLLDDVAGSSPEGLSENETQTQSTSNDSRDTAQALYLAALTHSN